MENIRICQGCRKKLNRADLIKITKAADGLLKINPDDKELGRSMYVCKNADCIKTVIKKKRIKAALKYSNSNEIEKVEQKLKELLD